MNLGIILAGGVGQRFGANLPKQFIELGGRPLLIYTLKAFEKAASIDKFILVSSKIWLSKTEALLQTYHFKKIEVSIIGGDTRFFSTWHALKYCREYFPSANLNLCIHDAVRPFIQPSKINELLNLLKNYQAATLVKPIVESLLEYDDSGVVQSIPNRSQWANIQTPQAFRFEKLYQAYLNAFAADNFTFTDDCGVLLHYQPTVKIKTLQGSPDNLKITHPDDLFLAEKIYGRYFKLGF